MLMVGDEVMVFVNDEYGYEEFFPANKHWILPFSRKRFALHFLEKLVLLLAFWLWGGWAKKIPNVNDVMKGIKGLIFLRDQFRKFEVRLIKILKINFIFYMPVKCYDSCLIIMDVLDWTLENTLMLFLFFNGCFDFEFILKKFGEKIFVEKRHFLQNILKLVFVN